MSQLVVCGLNHHSAPISVRERFSIPAESRSKALLALAELPHVEEVAILSTCNRTEIYAVVSDVQSGTREIENYFIASQTADGDGLPIKPNFRLIGDDVALHLFRVASGLDSMIMGEVQILGQLKSAHQAAMEMHTAGPTLIHTFDLAIKCGKRVRSETNIGRRAVSLSSAALEVGREIFGALNMKNVVVLGAGEMAQKCLKQLLSADPKGGRGKLSVLNRNRERVEKFLQGKINGKERLNCQADFSDRHQVAADADLLIVATSAPSFVISKDELAPYRKNSSRPLCIIDMSVPRNVERTVAELEGVSLYHADDLARIVETNLAEREALAEDADKIVFQVLSEFQQWWRARLVAPAISRVQRRMEEIRRSQTERLCERLVPCRDSRARQQVDRVSRAIVGQILHDLATTLKAGDDSALVAQQAAVIERIFSGSVKLSELAV